MPAAACDGNPICGSDPNPNDPVCTIDGVEASCVQASSLLAAGGGFVNFGPNWKYIADTWWGVECYANTVVDDVRCLGPFGGADASYPAPLAGGVNAALSAGDPNARKNYCLGQAHQAGLEELLPGITRGDYVPSALKVSQQAGAHLALDAAAASGVLKRAIRARTGVTMSVTEKFLGRLAFALLAYSGYEALNASRDEYQACMAY